MFAPTTDRSSSPRRYAIGSLPSALKRPTSSLANPWGNGYWQSFNSKLREELLNGEIFFSLAEAQVLIEAWRRQFNAVRPAVQPAPYAVFGRSRSRAASVSYDGVSTTMLRLDCARTSAASLR